MNQSIRYARYRERATDQGLVKVCVWIPATDRGALLNEAQRMRNYDRANVKEVVHMVGRVETAYVRGHFHDLTRADLLQVIDTLLTPPQQPGAAPQPHRR